LRLDEHRTPWRGVSLANETDGQGALLLDF